MSPITRLVGVRQARRTARAGRAVMQLTAFLPLAARAALFEVKQEGSSRQLSDGTVVAIDLWIPQRLDPGLPAPPYAAVVLAHGFARNRTYMHNNARHMAERGIVVATPDSPGWFGAGAQAANIDAMVGHFGWLVARSGAPGDSLAGLVDPARLGAAGHSAGGAVGFEAAIALQGGDTPLRAVFLLDAVPWDRTLTAAPGLRPLTFGSWRAAPSSCNADGNVLALIENVASPVTDVRVIGATHCDPENPTDFLCTLTCGGGSASARSLFQRAMTLFFLDAFVISLADEPESYASFLRRVEAEGKVVSKPLPGRDGDTLQLY